MFEPLVFPDPETIPLDQQFYIRARDIRKTNEKLISLGLDPAAIRTVGRSKVFVCTLEIAREILSRVGKISRSVANFGKQHAVRIIDVRKQPYGFADIGFERLYDVRVKIDPNGRSPFHGLSIQRAADEANIRKPIVVSKFSLLREDYENAKRLMISVKCGTSGIVHKKGCVLGNTLRLSEFYESSTNGLEVWFEEDNIPLADMTQNTIEVLVTPESNSIEVGYALLRVILSSYSSNVTQKTEEEFEELARSQIFKYGPRRLENLLGEAVKIQTEALRKKIESSEREMGESLRRYSGLGREIPILRAQLEGVESRSWDDGVDDIITEFLAIPEFRGFTRRKTKSTDLFIVYTHAFASRCVDKLDEPDRLIGPYELRMNIVTGEVKCVNTKPYQKRDARGNVTYTSHGPHLDSEGAGCHDGTIKNERARMVAEYKFPMATILTLQLLKQWRYHDRSGIQAIKFPVAPSSE